MLNDFHAIFRAQMESDTQYKKYETHKKTRLFGAKTIQLLSLMSLHVWYFTVAFWMIIQCHLWACTGKSNRRWKAMKYFQIILFDLLRLIFENRNIQNMNFD